MTGAATFSNRAKSPRTGSPEETRHRLSGSRRGWLKSGRETGSVSDMQEKETWLKAMWTASAFIPREEQGHHPNEVKLCRLLNAASFGSLIRRIDESRYRSDGSSGSPARLLPFSTFFHVVSPLCPSIYLSLQTTFFPQSINLCIVLRYFSSAPSYLLSLISISQSYKLGT